jgi:hypothetical protein
MATYFVRSDAANDTGAGTSWETAKKTLAAGLALLANSDTLLIRGEFYSQQLQLPDRTNITVSNDAGYPVVVDGEGALVASMIRSHNNAPAGQKVIGTIENGRHMFVARNAGPGGRPGYFIGNMTVDGIQFDTPTPGSDLIYCNTGNMQLLRLKASGVLGTFAVLGLYNGFQGTISHCVFEALSPNSVDSNKVISHAGTSNLVTNITNCYLYGTRSGSIVEVSNHTKTVNIFNNVIGPVGDSNSAYNGKLIVPLGSSPTVNHGNNIYIPNMLNSSYTFRPLAMNDIVDSQCVDTGGNIIDGARPKLTNYDGYIVIGVDDADYAYVSALGAVAEGHNTRLSWWVNQKNHALRANQAEANAAITDMANRGHDIAAHTRSHSVMSDMRAMNVQYTGGAGAANLTIASNVFSVVVPGNTAHNFSMDISTATIEALCTALNATGVYSAPITASDAGPYTINIGPGGGVNQFAYALAQGLADTTIDISTSRTLSYERNRFYKNEVDDVKTWLESFPGVAAVVSGSTGYNSGDATYTAYARNKFLSHRSNTALITPLVRNIDPFGIMSRDGHGIFGMAGVYDIAGHRVRARLTAESVCANGTAVCIFAHNANEVSIAEWAAIMEEWAKYPRLWVGSQRDFANLVMTDERWAQNGTRYERNMVADADYTPSPDSPAIDAGATALVSTDLYGGAIPGLGGPDIGPVEYMPGWTLFDGSMPSLSLAATCPGSLLEVQEWTKANVTKKQIDKVSP